MTKTGKTALSAFLAICLAAAAAALGGAAGRANALSVTTPVPVVTVECEAGKLLEGAQERLNSLASGGAYVGGIDNVGAGVELNFHCVYAGDYTVVVRYTQGMGNPQTHTLRVGETDYAVHYTESSGWGGEGSYPARETQVEGVAFALGLNTLTLGRLKEEDGFCEIDSVRIVPPEGAEYEKEIKTDFEAEEGTPIGASLSESQLASGGVFLDVASVNTGVLFEFTVDGTDLTAGNYEMTVYYLAPLPKACLDVFVGEDFEKPDEMTDYGKIAFDEGNGSFNDWKTVEEGDEPPAISEARIVLEMNEGVNYVKLIKNSAECRYVQLDRVSFAKTEKPVAEMFTGYGTPETDLSAGRATVEAEGMKILGKNTSVRGNKNVSGGWYLGAIDLIGDGMEFAVTNAEAGRYTLLVYYMTGAPEATHDVVVNGQIAGEARYTVNTGWGGVDNYGFEQTGVLVDLAAGRNVISIEKGATSVSFAEIDRVELVKGSVAPTAPLEGDRYEFEAGSRSEYVAEGAHYYLSGGGYVTGLMQEGDRVSLTVHSERAGEATLKIYYFRAAGDAVTLRVSCGDSSADAVFDTAAAVDVKSASSSAACVIVKLSLAAGENTVDFAYASGGDPDNETYLWLDYCDVAVAAAEPEKPAKGCGCGAITTNSFLLSGGVLALALAGAACLAALLLRGKQRAQ